MSNFFDFLLHLDVHLTALVQQYGNLTYGILFLIAFCETGLVFTPFLPGDSLIFVAATLASQKALNIFILWTAFTVASIAGDSVNYWVGTRFGHKLEASKSLRKDYLQKTQDFYARYGKKTLVMARFIPVVRTFAPFVAGMGRMNYRDFLIYNVVGGVAWVSFFTFVGYFFGRITWVQNHLETVILGIIFVSLLPPALEWWKARRKKLAQGE